MGVLHNFTEDYVESVSENKVEIKLGGDKVVLFPIKIECENCGHVFRANVLPDAVSYSIDCYCGCHLCWDKKSSIVDIW